MRIPSRLLAKWPALLATASVALIAMSIWDLLFPLRSKQQYPGIHITCFAYRDVNRNGVYDVEDRPYAGLKVTMERPKRGSVQRESNISGFANFDMSLGNRKADVYSPGEHTIRIESPQDWDVTSKNSVQTILIKKRDGAAVGMIAERTFEPVGVAPRLKISGSVEIHHSDLNSSNPVLKAKSPGGEEFVVTVSKSGDYSFPATAGKWRLEWATSNGKSISRDLSVNRYPVVASRIDPERLFPQPKPKLRIIGFDNLTASDTLYEIPNGYEGLDWHNWVATHQKLYRGNGYINATVSSEYVAYTSSGHPATSSSVGTFDFVGAYVGVAWPAAEHHDVVIKAWRHDAQVYQDRFKASTSGPVYFDADYRSVTRIEFASDGYWQIVLDDLACRTE